MRSLLLGLEETALVAFLFVLMWGAVRPGEILPVTVLAGVLLVWRTLSLL
jgi:hypothetical protein